MTGFFWAGCHQFQIEPEVLIKLSLAGFFFILTAEFQTQAGLLLTNLSTFFCGAVSYHPMAQGRETLPGSCFFLHWLLPAVCSESIARGAGVLSPCRCTSNLLAVLRIYVSSCLCGQQVRSCLACSALAGPLGIAVRQRGEQMASFRAARRLFRFVSHPKAAASPLHAWERELQ